MLDALMEDKIIEEWRGCSQNCAYERFYQDKLMVNEAPPPGDPKRAMVKQLITWVPPEKVLGHCHNNQDQVVTKM